MDCPWISLGQNTGVGTGVGSLSLLQGIFPTQGSNSGLPHCRQILYQLSHKGSPDYSDWSLSSVQVSRSVMSDSLQPHESQQAILPVHHQLPEFTQTHVLRVGDAIQPSQPLSSTSHLPSIFPSLRVFSNESALCIRWPKYWSFNFSISPSDEYSGRISFRMDWLDLLAVQGTLKSLLQHHSLKASIL